MFTCTLDWVFLDQILLGYSAGYSTLVTKSLHTLDDMTMRTMRDGWGTQAREGRGLVLPSERVQWLLPKDILLSPRVTLLFVWMMYGHWLGN